MVYVVFAREDNKIYGYDAHTGLALNDEIYTLTDNPNPLKNILFHDNKIKQYGIDGKRIEG